MATGHPALAPSPDLRVSIERAYARIHRERALGFAAAAIVAAIAGLATAAVMPRGATTATQGLLAIAIGLVLGLATGVLSRPAGPCSSSAVAYGLAYELARAGTVGPSVTAVRLDNTFGILALALNRGLHLLLFGLPLLVGDGIGRLVMRRRAGASLGRARWVPRAVGLALVIGLVALVAWPAHTPPVLGPDGTPVAGSLAELATVRLGGTDQAVMIRAADPDKPVLLYLSGGPGQSDLALSRVLAEGWTKDFVFVDWDQRGNGKSYAAIDPVSTFTLDRAVSDTIELSEYLRDRFGERKIYLMGESWGTILGVLAVQRRPDLFHAWIGSGQMVDVVETDRRVYRDLVAYAARAGDADLAAKLQAIGEPPYRDIPWANANLLAWYDYLYPDYTPSAGYVARGDGERARRRSASSGRSTRSSRRRTCCAASSTPSRSSTRSCTASTSGSDVPRLEVPVYILDGAAELSARRDVMAEWYDALEAPDQAAGDLRRRRALRGLRAGRRGPEAARRHDHPGDVRPLTRRAAGSRRDGRQLSGAQVFSRTQPGAQVCAIRHHRGRLARRPDDVPEARVVEVEDARVVRPAGRHGRCLRPGERQGQREAAHDHHDRERGEHGAGAGPSGPRRGERRPRAWRPQPTGSTWTPRVGRRTSGGNDPEVPARCQTRRPSGGLRPGGDRRSVDSGDGADRLATRPASRITATSAAPVGAVDVDGVPLGPWRLAPNRVERFYTGGALLERFQGLSEDAARDGHRPEDWVGSVTAAWRPPGEPPTRDGLSVVDEGGTRRTIAELLAADPAAVAGQALVDRAGATTGLLVKLLDAGARLPVHAHPSRAFAREHLGSSFGKAEAWLIVATRHVPRAEAPNLRLGFRRDVTRDELLEMVERQDTDRLLEAMHVRPARAGDTWFVPPGVPHAIGAGVFMVEIEEPSDFSIVAETRGVPVDPADAHLRLGWERAIDAFERRGLDDAGIDALRQQPVPIEDRQGLRRVALTGHDADPFFRAERVTVRGRARPDWEPAFLIGIVTMGSGVARAGDRSLAVSRGESFAVPAAVLPDLELESADGLELIACLPPRPWELGPAPGPTA